METHYKEYQKYQNALALFRTPDMFSVDWIGLARDITTHPEKFNPKIFSLQNQLIIKTCAMAQTMIVQTDSHIPSRIVNVQHNSFRDGQIQGAMDILIRNIVNDVSNIDDIRLSYCILYYLNSFTPDHRRLVKTKFADENYIWELHDTTKKTIFDFDFTPTELTDDDITHFFNRDMGPLWTFNFELFLAKINSKQHQLNNNSSIHRMKTYALGMRDIKEHLGFDYDHIVEELQSDTPNYVIQFFRDQKDIIQRCCESFTGTKLFFIHRAYVILDIFDLITNELQQLLEKTFDMDLFWSDDPIMGYEYMQMGGGCFWEPL